MARKTKRTLRQRENADCRNETKSNEMEHNKASRLGIYLFSIGMFAIGFGAGLLFTSPWVSIWSILGSALFGWILADSIRIAPQWERVAILKFGRFSRIAGPGFYTVVPLIEYPAMHIDHRIMTDSFNAEKALTVDLVPVDVDAVLFWVVWDAKRVCLEVEDYSKAVLCSAQTALRDAIGQVALADLSMRRKQVDHDLEEALTEKCEQWGIAVLSVEIRDIIIPRELQNALSREAQAEKERDARIILAEVEKEISEMFVEAADVYERNPNALKLRAMNLAYEGAKDSKGTLLVPSALADGFDVRAIGKNIE